MANMLKLSVEIANTPSKREKGLMFRKTLGENEGMLFRFTHNDVLSFWMKNTYIPLDIAFIDDNGVIFDIKSMSPLNTKSVSSSKECKYALEVNRDWFNKNNITEGSRVKGIYFENKVKIAQIQEQPQNPQNQSEQPKPEVVIDRSIKEKIKYAETQGLKLRILYVTKDGYNVGPRILSPVNNQYIINNGENGEYVVGYDESPRIDGGTYVIESLTPKSFLISGIINLEVIDTNGNVLM